jgi:hypothetical protein
MSTTLVDEWLTWFRSRAAEKLGILPNDFRLSDYGALLCHGGSIGNASGCQIVLAIYPDHSGDVECIMTSR